MEKMHVSLIQEWQQSEMRAHSMRNWRVETPPPEQKVDVATKVEPFVKEEVLVSIYNVRSTKFILHYFHFVIC